jgi:hypothetical protein
MNRRLLSLEIATILMTCGKQEHTSHARNDRRSRVREPEKFPWGGLRRLARLLGLKQMAEKNKDGERLLPLVHSAGDEHTNAEGNPDDLGSACLRDCYSH